MEIDEKIREQMDEKASPLTIKKWAESQGMNTLRENAIKKLLQG